MQGVVLAGAHPTSKAAVPIAVPSPTAVSTLPDPDGLHANGKYLAIGRSEGIDRDAKELPCVTTIVAAFQHLRSLTCWEGTIRGW